MARPSERNSRARRMKSGDSESSGSIFMGDYVKKRVDQMSGFDNVRVAVCVRLLWCLAVSVAVTVNAAPDVVEPVKSVRSGAAPKRHPLVVLKQTEINGRVFFLPDEGEGDALAARQLEVTVHDRDGDKLLHKTVTRDDGTFTLPDLEVGIYQIRLGGLVLELNVLARSETIKKSIPKSLLVFMPRELEK